MIATTHNTRGTCNRCGRQRPFVLAAAFQGDGSATFRFLCASCERIEAPRNQPTLFRTVPVFVPVVVVEEEEEAAPVVPSAQLTMF